MKKVQKAYVKIVCHCGREYTRFLPLDHTPIACGCGTVIMIEIEGQEKLSLERVDLRCEFIMVDHWFIDAAKITHAYIDSGHIVLSLMGGQSLIFDNDEMVADVSGNVLNGPLFHALSDFLRERFHAKDIHTPADEALLDIKDKETQ